MKETTMSSRLLAMLVVFAFMAQLLLPAMLVNAAALTSTYVRLDSMKAGADTTVRVLLTPTSTATEDEVEVDFGSAWTSASGAVNTTTQTVATGACESETTATALPTATSLSAAASGTVVSVTGVSTLTATTTYCFDLTTTDAVTNPTAGSYTVNVKTLASAATVDELDVAVDVIADDEIVVNAVVPPIFDFALDGLTANFTTDLSSSSVVSTANRTVTIDTNADSGWVTWIRNSDANGLYSTTTATDIDTAFVENGTAVTLSTGAVGYVWGITAQSQVGGAGTISLDGDFDATGAAHGDGVDNSSYKEIATSNGTADTAVLTLTGSATISSLTPAGNDYTDTIQVIGAGNF